MTHLTPNSITAQTRSSFIPVRDRLDRRNRRDTFFFTLSGRSNFNAVLSAIQRNANVDLVLFNGAGQRIGRSAQKGNRPEAIRLNPLEAGTYTLQAVLKGRQPTRYTLRSTAILNPGTPPLNPGAPSPTDNAGNTPDTARLVNLSPTPSSFADRVGSTDRDDFYRFTVGDAANPSVKFNLLLTRTPGINLANINLRDNLGNTVKSVFVGSSDGSGTMTETLAAGTYVVQVNSSSTEPFVYNLALAAAPVPDTAGNTLTTARTLSISPAPTTLTEFVGTGDIRDFYRLTIGVPGSPSGTFSVSVTGVGGNLLSGNATVRLRDELGNVIQSEAASGGGGTLFDRILAAGSYFLEVETSAPSVDYSLNLTSNPIADSAGNTLPTARSVSIGSTPAPFTDFVGPGDLDDYYRFTIPSGNFNLTLTGGGGNLLSTSITARLLDSLGNQIQSSFASSSGGGATLSRSLSAGTYFMRLETSGSSVGSNYNLALSLT